MSNKQTDPDALVEEKAAYDATDVEMSISIPKCMIHYVISTGTQDHEGDIMGAKSFDFSTHQKNPLAVFDHDLGTPIGTWADNINKDFSLEKIEDFYSVKYTKDDVVEGDLYFDQDSYNAMALFDMAIKGIYIGCSPGFIIKAYRPNPNSKYGRIYDKAHLIEAGPCAVGENPDAIARWVEKSYSKEFKEKINPKILTELKSFLPQRKVMLLTGKSKSGVSRVDGNTSLKPGHKALDEFHTTALAFKGVLIRLKSMTDHPDVSEFLGEIETGVQDAMEQAEEKNKTLFPDHPELKADETKEYHIPEEEMRCAKALKAYERGLKDASDVNKRLQTQLDSLVTKSKK